MSNTQKKIGYWVFVLAGFAVGLAFYWLNPLERAAANPVSISQPGQNQLSTSSATSTPSFKTPGTATTTLTLDVINRTSTTSVRITPTDASGSIAINEAHLAVQIVGSSTASLLDIIWEYSQDGIDFYRDYASSTTRIAYASTTPSGQPFNSFPAYPGTGNISNLFLLQVPKIPARYVRAVMVVPIGSLNSTSWAQFITKVER